MDSLEELNEKQREALLQTEGPILIIAGAGSGKTKVLTSKIAYVLDQGLCKPWEILAITFTNKAAREMQDRVGQIVGSIVHDIWIGTFHKICLRILRRNINLLGFDSNFVIYDTIDKRSVIDEVMDELEISSKEYNQKAFATAISNNKNKLISPEKAVKDAEGVREETYANVYLHYQKRLKQNNALDFDDIINVTIDLLKNNQEVLEYYQNKFRYVYVDEYQDTNMAQFELVKLLSGKYKNITVVGDNDQGIYSFRGADISNILDFEKDFEGAKTIYLEQNYRSTKNILNLANYVINSNKTGVNKKYIKKLWTDNKDGKKPLYVQVQSAYDEANFIARTIKKLKIEEDYKNSDFAILYRVNALSRVIESVFVRENIPSQIIGGHKFYEREEIKDSLAFLRLIDNPKDDVSFRRIINKPTRGIGQKKIEEMAEISAKTSLSLYEVLKKAEEFKLEKTYEKAIEGKFLPIVKYAEENKDDIKISELLPKILKETGYIQMLEDEKSDKAISRLKNIDELIDSIIEFEKEEADSSLRAYLENISLSTDTDQIDEEDGMVTMMTLHSSKGLEYPIIFMVGMEEGTFPSERSVSEGNLEEEQRLCYVGMTRAEKQLYLISTLTRKLYDRTQTNIPSRFLDDIPEDLLEREEDGSVFNNVFGNVYANSFGETYYKIPKKEKKTRYVIDPDDDFEKSKPKQFKDFISTFDVRNKEIDVSKYKIGQKVRHKKFGDGKILSITPENDDNIVEIEFEKIGIKRLMLKFANIEIIE